MKLCNGDGVKNGFEDGIGGVLPLDAGQEATVRTGHGTTDWFQILGLYLY